MKENSQKGQPASETHHAETLARTVPMVRGESAEAVRQTYSQLKTQAEKDAFWAEWLHTLDQTAAHGWRGLYEALNLLRESDYWQRAGHESFEEFWREQGRFPFEQLLNLEHTYHFAKAACPDLFEVEYDAAENAFKSVLRNGSRRDTNGATEVKKNGEFLVFDWDEIIAELRGCGVPDGLIAQVETARRGGGNSAISRLRILKRDHPRIAQDFLEGKFLTKSGKPNLAAAEKAAGISRASGPKKTPQERAETAFASLSPEERRAFVDRMSKRFRAAFR